MSASTPADLRVLVVDDDFMVARIHTRFVEQTDGFVVAGTAHTAADALRLVTELEPDLVLLDVHLPDRSGLEVLEQLRTERRRVAVLMVTAERDAEVVRDALHGGARQYLVKPFSYDDLAQRLRQVAAAMGVLSAGEADQQAIDRAFGTAGARATPARLPKGLSPETAELVLALLRQEGEVSASGAGDELGLSRVTARRYLEHFADSGRAEVRLQYGSAGRPERRYRAV